MNENRRGWAGEGRRRGRINNTGGENMNAPRMSQHRRLQCHDGKTMGEREEGEGKRMGEKQGK